MNASSCKSPRTNSFHFSLFYLLLLIVGSANAENYALQFDGDDQVTIPHHSSLSFPGTSNHTIELWFKYTGTLSTYHILGKRGGCTHSGLNYQIARDSNALLHTNSCYDVVSAGTNPPQGEWIHMAVTYDGSLVKLYLNGELSVTTPFTYGCENDTPLLIGASGSCGGDFIGLIDEVRIWSTARSAEEIANSYNKIINPTTTGLVGYWNFDETPDQQTVLDSSPLANNGTIGATLSAGPDDPARVLSDAPLVALDHDARVAEILAPIDVLDLNTAIAPQAVIENLGLDTDTIGVTFQIGFDYIESADITLAAGESGVVTFPEWHANQLGSVPLQVSTSLSGDGAPYNDALRGVVAIAATTTAPVITGVSPNHGGNTGTVTVTIEGDNFQEGAQVKLTRTGNSDVLASPIKIVDSEHITTLLDLEDIQPGEWNIIITNPNSEAGEYHNIFSIEDGGSSNVITDILGRNLIRTQQPQSYWIDVSNTGSIDSGFTYALIELSNELTYKTNVAPGLPSSLGMESSNKFGFGIPNIPPGSSTTVPIDITAMDIGSFDIKVGTYVLIRNTNLLPPPIDTDTFPPFWNSSDIPPPGYIVLYEDFSGVGSVGISLGDGGVAHFLPGGSLGYGSPDGLNVHSYNIYTPSAIIRPPDWTLEKAQQRVAEFFQKWEVNLLANGTYESYYNGQKTSYVNKWPKMGFPDMNCADWSHYFWPELILLSPEKISDVVGELYDKLYQYWYSEGFREEPYQWKGPSWTHWLPDWLYDALEKHGLINSVGSWDPNDKIGLQGAGDGNYLTGDRPNLYIVFFENKEAATAPAQEVVISDQLTLDSMDLSTLSLGEIAFGDTRITPPAGLTSYSTEIDLRPGNNLVVRVDAALDIFTGLLTWNFSSIDPDTGEPPEDPLAGFLPPNTTPPEGEGHVLFTVMPKAGLSTGTVICNQANIVFDTNAPILTPQWCNTIDNDAPESEVLPLGPTQSSLDFEVYWTGTDTGAGMGDHTIYVSEDGAPYAPWLTNTPDTMGLFSGENGKSYAFYSVARDLAGNAETKEAVAEATTTVTVTSPAPGDLDGDGDIDSEDYALIRATLGKCEGEDGYNPAADYDGDGCVSIKDYRTWYGYYTNQ